MSPSWDRIATAVLGFGIAANGVYMLVAPAAWYGTAPGALQTGPLNPHFVRDVGAAYLAAGAALFWFGFDARARPAGVAAAAFLNFHAALYAAEALGRHGFISAFDLLNVFIPAALALWLAWPDPKNRTCSG
jgi:hypothetical protein